MWRWSRGEVSSVKWNVAFELSWFLIDIPSVLINFSLFSIYLFLFLTIRVREKKKRVKGRGAGKFFINEELGVGEFDSGSLHARKGRKTQHLSSIQITKR